MKILKMCTIVCALVALTHLSADQEASVGDAFVKELKLGHLDLNNLAVNEAEKPSRILPLVKSSAQAGLRSVAIVPFSQGLTYISGMPCHVANYAQTSIITVLEGPNYGLQIIVDYDGHILSLNPSYIAEHSRKGVVFKHFYPDCKVVTGMDQVIVLR